MKCLQHLFRQKVAKKTKPYQKWVQILGGCSVLISWNVQKSLTRKSSRLADENKIHKTTKCTLLFLVYRATLCTVFFILNKFIQPLGAVAPLSLLSKNMLTWINSQSEKWGIRLLLSELALVAFEGESWSGGHGDSQHYRK